MIAPITANLAAKPNALFALAPMIPDADAPALVSWRAYVTVMITCSTNR
ncbi:unannotated protein [freshwater metagenome]|uniref:Unannotated protein n=1 Tax=freshwater metagenome TaxID=449393 RepID=A0A6J6X5I5_9ZZZZ